MSDPGTKRDAHSLVSSLLGKSGGSAPVLPDDSPLSGTAALAGFDQAAATLLQAAEAQAAEARAAAAAASAAEPPAAPATQEEIDREARELVEVYFTLESPAERDVLLDRIATLRSPVATDFLKAMMEEDEDEIVRAAAAAVLAKQGLPEAIAALEADLADPEEPYFFQQALLTLCEIRGAAFYDELVRLWHNPERDAAERREAMAAMETVDPKRAVRDFAAFIEAQHDIAAMPDDQVELAMLAFLRQGYREAVPLLEALRDRVTQAPIDPEERAELVDFVQEGLDLLAGG